MTGWEEWVDGWNGTGGRGRKLELYARRKIIIIIILRQAGRVANKSEGYLK